MQEYVFLVIALAIAVMVILSRVDAWAVAAFAAFTVGAFVAVVETAGKSRPAWTEWRDVGSVLVLNEVYEPGEAIYLLVDSGGDLRLYSFPWSTGTARKLQEARREAGEGLVRVIPGGFGESDIEVHPLPPWADPPKD